MTIPPLSLGIIKGAEWLKALNAEMFLFGQAHGHMNKSAEHTSVHALAGRLQAGPSGNLELTVPASLIKGVFDALDEPGAEFVVRNSRTESAIKVMTKEEIAKLGGVSHISERGHSYHYTLGPIVELPATGDYDKLWAISIKSNDLEDIRKSYGLETSPQLGFYIPVGCKKKRVTESNAVSKLASLLKLSANDQSIGSSSGQPAAAPKPTASSATQPTSPSGNVGAQNTLSGGAGYRQPFNQSASNNLNDMYAKFQKDNPNSPVPQRPAPIMAPSPTPAPSNFAGQADAQLQGNVPIPTGGFKPQGGPISAKQQDMENIKHYQEQANTNIANNRPNTLAAERTRQNDESNQKATEIMGATLGVSRAGDLTGHGIRSVGGQFIKAVTPTIGGRAANVSTGLLGAAAPAAGYMTAENVARASGQNTLGQMGTPTTPVQGVMAAPRFAELAGIDATSYAKGIPAKITASMGGGPVANTNDGSVSGEVANVPRG